MAETLQVDTQAVAVEIALVSGARLAGEMFLRPGAAGAETILARMNDGAGFFPVKDKDGAVVLVGKAQVRYVITPSLDDDDRVAEERASVPQVLVTAELDSGESITGVFFLDAPHGKARTLDYVNETKAVFLPVAQLDREYLVNRNLIVTLRDVKE